MGRASVRDGSATTRVAEGIRAQIARGELVAGSRIRQEDVAALYGASRVPVREALKILEADGLVTLKPNSGAWVAQLSMDECEEIYLMRERIEPLLLRYSASKLSGDELEALYGLALEMESTDDVDHFLRLDRTFHQLTYARADTIVLKDTVQRLWNATQHYRRAFTLLLDDRSQRVLHDEHRSLLDAIAVGDIGEAEHVLHCHVRRTRLALLRHPEVFAPPV